VKTPCFRGSSYARADSNLVLPSVPFIIEAVVSRATSVQQVLARPTVESGTEVPESRSPIRPNQQAD